MDKIFIYDLQIDTIIGILPHEETQPQPIILNLEISTDTRIAAASKDLHDTIDYAAINQNIITFVSTHKFKLLETLAEEIAKLILKKNHVKAVRIQITKPQALPNTKQVGIIIERHN